MDYTDGSTSAERLAELMNFGAERDEVDYKRQLDLGGGSKKDTVAFAKDCMAFMNRPTGGYLVVGVDDNGKVDPEATPITKSHFDPSQLQDKVQTYVDAQVRISCNVHKVDDRLVALIYVHPAPGGLPVPAAKDGTYKDARSNRDAFEFHKGQVFVRQGASNVVLKHSHWPDLLSDYRRRVRDEARADIDRLVHSVAELLGQAQLSAGAPVLPLEPALEPQDYAQAVRGHLDQEKTAALMRQTKDLLAVVARSARPGMDELSERLDRVAIIGVEALRSGDKKLYAEVVSALARAFDTYADIAGDSQAVMPDGIHLASVYLEFLKRLYALGSCAVREQAWWALPALYGKPVTVDHYTYTTWLRYGQVMASRAGLFQSRRETADGQEEPTGSQLLTQSLQLLLAVPELRPDLPGPAGDGDDRSNGIRELLLNSLCAFDLWQCVGASLSRQEKWGSAYYPSFASFQQHRVDPALQLMLRDRGARAEAFDGAEDATIHKHLVEVVNAAEREALNNGSFNWGLVFSGMTKEMIDQLLPAG